MRWNRGVWLQGLVASALLVSATAGRSEQNIDDERIRDFLSGRGQGSVSYEQFVSSIAAKTMRDLDLNKDGSISREEAEVAQEQAAQRDSGEGVAVVGVIESQVENASRVDFDALKRSLSASPQMRSLYESLESRTTEAPADALAAPRAFPQVRIRF